MANFKKVSVETGARVELHDLLSLTGAEISVNSLPAGAGVPFVMTISTVFSRNMLYPLYLACICSREPSIHKCLNMEGWHKNICGIRLLSLGVWKSLVSV